MSTTFGECEIHDTARISFGAVVGLAGEANPPRPCETVVRIGANVTLREHAVVQRGFERDTRIGAGCYVMHGAHVAHDCVLGVECTLSPFVVLGGHTTLLPRVTMGIHSATHQWVTVGEGAMIGMGAIVLDDVPPYAMVVGNPGRIIGLNVRGMEKHGVREADLPGLHTAWQAARSGKRREARER